MNKNVSYDQLGQKVIKVTTPKFKHYFEVYKPIGPFSYYKIRASKGTLSTKLEGSFTSPELALAKLENYIRVTKETAIAARDRKYKENHATETAITDDKE